MVVCNACGLRGKRLPTDGVLPRSKIARMGPFGRIPSDEGRLRGGVAAWALIRSRSLAHLGRVKQLNKVIALKGRLLGSRVLVAVATRPSEPAAAAEAQMPPPASANASPKRTSSSGLVDAALAVQGPMLIDPDTLSHGQTTFLEAHSDDEGEPHTARHVPLLSSASLSDALWSFSPYLLSESMDALEGGAGMRQASPAVGGGHDLFAEGGAELRPCVAVAFDYISGNYQVAFGEPATHLLATPSRRTLSPRHPPAIPPIVVSPLLFLMMTPHHWLFR